jgi:hypothetical protein
VEQDRRVRDDDAHRRRLTVRPGPLGPRASALSWTFLRPRLILTI